MDADWAGDPEDRKSTTEAIVFYHGNPVSWISQKQKTVCTSISEAEYKLNDDVRLKRRYALL